jgi:hypothetical protein
MLGQQLLLGGVEIHQRFLRGDLLRLLLWRVGGAIVTAVTAAEQEPPPRHRGLSLLLQLALIVVVVGYHSLEKREFRDRDIMSYPVPRNRERSLHTCAQDVQITRMATI